MVAEQSMPGMKGVGLLEEVHKRPPGTTKILLTGQAGLDAVVAAINRAGLNRYIPKPWDEPDLRLTVEGLLRIFRLNRENVELFSDLRAKNAELAAWYRALYGNSRERTHALDEAYRQLYQLALTDGGAQPAGRLTIWVGVAACPADARSPEALLGAADAALYRAKKGGRDRVVTVGVDSDVGAVA